MQNLRGAGICLKNPFYFLLLVALICSSTPVLASGISISGSGSISLGVGSIDLSCGDLVVNGALSLGESGFSGVGSVVIDEGLINGDLGAIALSGGWNNDAGVFIPGSSQVIFNEQCGDGDIHISGNTIFYNLSVENSDRRLIFESGSTTGVNGHLQLTGKPGSPLRILSDQPGSPANLLVNGSYLISGVDVRDNHVSLSDQWIDENTPSSVDFIDSGGNAGWWAGNLTTAVPVMGKLATGLMILLILTAATRRKVRTS